MFAHDIDLVNGSARVHQGFVEGDGVLKGDGFVERQLEEGTASAADEEEDEGVCVRLPEHFQRQSRGLEGILIGNGMTGRRKA